MVSKSSMIAFAALKLPLSIAHLNGEISCVPTCKVTRNIKNIYYIRRTAWQSPHGPQYFISLFRNFVKMKATTTLIGKPWRLEPNWSAPHEAQNQQHSATVRRNCCWLLSSPEQQTQAVLLNHGINQQKKHIITHRTHCVARQNNNKVGIIEIICSQKFFYILLKATRIGNCGLLEIRQQSDHNSLGVPCIKRL